MARRLIKRIDNKEWRRSTQMIAVVGNIVLMVLMNIASIARAEDTPTEYIQTPHTPSDSFSSLNLEMGLLTAHSVTITNLTARVFSSHQSSFNFSVGFPALYNVGFSNYVNGYDSNGAVVSVGGTFLGDSSLLNATVSYQKKVGKQEFFNIGFGFGMLVVSSGLLKGANIPLPLPVISYTWVLDAMTTAPSPAAKQEKDTRGGFFVP